MDLYEALKNGSTREELVDLFNKELDEANGRLKEEQEAATAKNKKLADARKLLTAALRNYAEVYGFDFAFTKGSDFEEVVAEIEENLSKIKHFAYKTTGKDTDMDIILNFIKTL